jgi:hypothetical protein
MALRLLDEGVEPDAVARVLDVEPEAVGPLLKPAEAKLAGITGWSAGLDVGTGRAEEALDWPATTSRSLRRIRSGSLPQSAFARSLGLRTNSLDRGRTY